MAAQIQRCTAAFIHRTTVVLEPLKLLHKIWKHWIIPRFTHTLDHWRSLIEMVKMRSYTNSSVILLPPPLPYPSTCYCNLSLYTRWETYPYNIHQTNTNFFSDSTPPSPPRPPLHVIMIYPYTPDGRLTLLNSLAVPSTVLSLLGVFLQIVSSLASTPPTVNLLQRLRPPSVDSSSRLFPCPAWDAAGLRRMTVSPRWQLSALLPGRSYRLGVGPSRRPGSPIATSFRWGEPRCLYSWSLPIPIPCLCWRRIPKIKWNKTKIYIGNCKYPSTPITERTW